MPRRRQKKKERKRRQQMSDAGEKEKKRPASYILTTNIHRVWGVYRCCQMVLLFSEDSRQL